MSHARQVVVGFDGSPDARAGLAWALREATSRTLGVRVVYSEPDLSGMDAATATLSESQVLVTSLNHHGPELIAEAISLAEQAGVAAESVSTSGPAAAVLVDQSRDAELVVVGSRGKGALTSLILGSTVGHVAAHAHCPVVVVRAEGDDDGPVVCGVDGSAGSDVVLGWAFDHASRHGRALEVVHAYAVPVYPGVVPYVPPVEISEATAEFEERVASEVLAGWREQYPDVAVSMSVQHGRPAGLLVAASTRASLTVVGSHGRGAFLGMLLGSTSQSLLHHAGGSVAVIRVTQA